MDNKNNDDAGIKVSILEGDDMFHNRIISRQSSMGIHSSRNYYRSCTDQLGVPFKWEKEPGKPKYQAEEDDDEHIPPLSPPPGAMQLNSGCPPALHKPQVDVDQEHMGLKPSSVLFWLRLWKKIRKKTSKQNKLALDVQAAGSGVEFCGSDGKFITSSSRDSSASSLSSSFSSSINAQSQSSKTQSPARDFLDDDDGPLMSCTPWNYNPTLFCVPRRV